MRIPQVTHLPGGNFYDDLRIDISASHTSLDAYLRSEDTQRRNSGRSHFFSKLRYYFLALLQRADLLDSLCFLGWRRKWFYEFRSYWGECLGGRPIVPVDFYFLYHEYRKRQQLPQQLEWGSPDQHIRNWQNPVHLFSIFYYVRHQARCPIVPMHIWRYLSRSARILEYGCSLAPFYTCATEFCLTSGAHWTLADLPTFAYHYTKYRYRKRKDVTFITISDFSAPLAGQGPFDAIFLTTVLEHVDDPVAVMEYLFGKMKSGAVLVFDYIKSDGTGLDTPSSLAARSACIELIRRRTKVVRGSLDTEGHIPLSIAILK